MCLGFVRGYGRFVAVRDILGLTEGGLLAGMVLSSRGCIRVGSRCGLASSTRPSRALAHLELRSAGSRSLGHRSPGRAGGWRRMVTIEGLITIIAGAIAFLGMPNSPATAKYLTEEERE
ncbi:Putative transporter C11D3.18C [Tolypocladium paradoxum]|uniref:Transporter C11D3.18C n=1 Tax=Tolypocladium paradoxum TaxID=94208 RepID=A0A2S4L714_9HYPO|nr:Putative transporter C11D3.18C [Tolypocladium paradoxum]